MARKADTGRAERILIIRLGAIGDVLLATPVIRALSARFPESRIDFLTKEAYIPLLTGNPGLNRVIGFSPENEMRGMAETVRRVRAGEYGLVADLQNNFRSRCFTRFSGARTRRIYHSGRLKRFALVHFRMDRYGEPVPVPLKYLAGLRGLGAEDDGKGLDLFPDDSARESVRALLKRAGVASGERIVVLAPGAGRPTKRWPAAHFAEAGRYFGGRGFRVAILGGPKDAEACASVLEGIGRPAISFCGSTTLLETAALLEGSALLVSNDTGIMHMASALKVPTVAVFGPTTRHFGFFPFRSPAEVLERNLPCRPCSFHGTDRCPETHFKCMRTISSGDAVSAAERLLAAE
jgi:lipopolysaccharide heptosyltransferase II